MNKMEAIALLRQGRVTKWNACLDGNFLRGIDLRGIDLGGVDLAGAILHRADLSEARLVRAILYRADLHGTSLRGADLSGAILDEADLHGANFHGANFSGANLSRADLSGAILDEADLSEARLIRARLSGADLSGADLQGANFHGANFSGANLSGANLSGADLQGANFSGANLSGTDLSGTDLSVANFIEANLGGANLSKAKVIGTLFVRVDLGSTRNLVEVVHHGPSSIGIDTLFKSNFNIPESFLEGAGVPRRLIEYLPSFKEFPIQYYSCFISYSGKDEAFATRVYEGLKSQGIRAWYAPKEMKGGRFLLDQIDQAIRLHDKLLLVLSEDSMKSDWVNTEIYKARKKEKQTGKKVLFPISIMPHQKIVDWECFDADTGMDMARDIRKFYIPDFSDWKDHDSFQAEFERLVRDFQGTEE